MKKIFSLLLALVLVFSSIQALAVDTIEYDANVDYMQLMINAANEGTADALEYGAQYEALRNRKIQENGLSYSTTSYFTDYDNGEDILAAIKADSSNSSSTKVTVINTASNSTTTKASYKVTAALLNCRSKASTSSSVVGQFKKGTTVTALGETSNGFAKVQYGNVTGWCSLSYLQSVTTTTSTAATETSSETVYYKVTATKLNCRSKASTTSSIIGQFLKNSVVTYLGTTSNGFAKVQCGNVTGWCSLTYLEKTTISSTSNAQADSSDSDTVYYEVTATLLNCRSEASTKAGVVGQFAGGTVVEYLGQTTNGFAKVENGSTTGWCSTSYLTETDAEGTSSDDETEGSADYHIVAAIKYTQEDLDLLALAIYREAGATWLSDLEQLMVGNVILNRVESDLYPDTIKAVLTQKGQYSWASSGNFSTEDVTDRCYTNALRLLNGERFCPSNVIFEACFKQGSGVYLSIYHANSGRTSYYCYYNE